MDLENIGTSAHLYRKMAISIREGTINDGAVLRTEEKNTDLYHRQESFLLANEASDRLKPAAGTGNTLRFRETVLSIFEVLKCLSRYERNLTSDTEFLSKTFNHSGNLVEPERSGTAVGICLPLMPEYAIFDCPMRRKTSYSPGVVGTDFFNGDIAASAKVCRTRRNIRVNWGKLFI